MSTVMYLTTEQLEAGLDFVRQSPKNGGRLEMIVRRPRVEAREVLEEGELDLEMGLVGDNWLERGSGRTADGSAHPDMQLNVINARLLDLVAQDRARWQLAGDQLIVDFDLSEENIPPGTQLAIGSSRDRGDGAAAHRVPEIRGALWPGSDALRQLAGRKAAASARH